MPHLPSTPSAGTLRERFIADMSVRGYTAKDATRPTCAPSPVLPPSSSARRAPPRLRTSAAFRSSSPSAG